MNIDKQIVSAIENTYSTQSGDNVSGVVDGVLRKNKDLCDYLEAALSESDDEQIETICPVVVNRNDRLTRMQLLLESPISSCGWLVTTNKRVIYAGILSRPLFHAWGSLSNVAQAPDNSVFLFEKIDRVKFVEGGIGRGPGLEIRAIDGEQLKANADAGFGDSLRSMSEYIDNRISG